jgi:exopolyphosphatase/guanosine-5'-triphosphate,3'-diphosphate pyrophosphatase
MALSFGSRRKRERPHGVIDIGSNSIRMVIFDELSRSPEQLFNERVTTLLGRELASTGNLSSEGAELALEAVARFRVIAAQYEVADLTAVATAASRDAKNGLEFIAEAEAVLGQSIHVVPGPEEGRISAMGVLAGIPDACGLMGDLGGGSLELTRIGSGAIHETTSFKLGVLRLSELFGEDASKIRKAVRKAVRELPFLKHVEGASLYTVGGLWRNVARLHMEEEAYPLRMLHEYSMTAGSLNSLARRVIG